GHVIGDKRPIALIVSRLVTLRILIKRLACRASRWESKISFLKCLPAKFVGRVALAVWTVSGSQRSLGGQRSERRRQPATIRCLFSSALNGCRLSTTRSS